MHPMVQKWSKGVAVGIALVSILGSMHVGAASASESKRVVDRTVLFWAADLDNPKNLHNVGRPVLPSSQKTTATKEGVHLSVMTSGLDRGRDYSLLLVFFNYPENCRFPSALPGSLDRGRFQCSALDFYLTPSAGPEYLTSSSSPGAVLCDRFRATGDLDRGDCFVPVRAGGSGDDPLLPTRMKSWGNSTLVNPIGAEYHAVLRRHGSVRTPESPRLRILCFDVGMQEVTVVGSSHTEQWNL